jgi:hypothetical protein
MQTYKELNRQNMPACDQAILGDGSPVPERTLILYVDRIISATLVLDSYYKRMRP